jgi:hypothetical protein
MGCGFDGQGGAPQDDPIRLQEAWKDEAERSARLAQPYQSRWGFKYEVGDRLCDGLVNSLARRGTDWSLYRADCGA